MQAFGADGRLDAFRSVSAQGSHSLTFGVWSQLSRLIHYTNCAWVGGVRLGQSGVMDIADTESDASDRYVYCVEYSGLERGGALSIR